MFGNSWFKKERPLLGMTGFGGGADGKLVSGAAPQFAASGGTETTPGNGYKYHLFTAAGPSPFVVTGGGNCEVFMMSGGGSGGNDIGGGGGCTLYYHNSYPLDAGTYAIAVGYKGVTYPGPTATPGPPSGAKGDGGSTSISSPTALVVETGVGKCGEPAGAGGGISGKGGDGAKIINGVTTPYSGGNGNGASGGSRLAGGGGGIAGAGENYDTDGPNTGGDGGAAGQYPAFAGPLIGSPTIAPSGYYGGGGGGGTESPTWTAGTGGGAGAGNGGQGQGPHVGGAASPQNLGSGGGAGGGKAGVQSGFGGDGSSGICIIRYTVA